MDGSTGGLSSYAPITGQSFAERQAAAGPWRMREWLIAGILFSVTFLVYSPALTADFVNYDDPVYVTANANLHEGFTLDTIIWAFSERRRSSHWHPLTWISLALDFELFGFKAWGYHLINVVLHSANAILVFAVFRLATGRTWSSVVVAALFAWHPLNVEPVAWVSGRKDLLAAFFWLSSTLVYLHYVRKPSARLYFESLVLFALALLSKSMAVTMPVTLLLWDAWIGRPDVSWRRIAIEKLPYFALSAGCAAMTVWAMSGGGTMRSLDRFGLMARIANALTAHVHYLGQLVWPTGMIPFYAISVEPPAALALAVDCSILVGISAAAIGLARRESSVLFGWTWFLIVLFPVNGLFKTGAFAFADRYMYLPGIGIFVAAVFSGVRWLPKWWAIAGWSIILTVLAAASWRQAAIWQDSVALWSHAVEFEPENYFARYNLGTAYEASRENDLALTNFEKAVALRPDQARARLKLSAALSRVGRERESIEELRKAAQLDERYRGLYESALLPKE